MLGWYFNGAVPQTTPQQLCPPYTSLMLVTVPQPSVFPINPSWLIDQPRGVQLPYEQQCSGVLPLQQLNCAILSENQLPMTSIPMGSMELPNEPVPVSHPLNCSKDSSFKSRCPRKPISSKRNNLRRNTETNICNQAFSFLFYPRKSSHLLKRLLTSKAKGKAQQLYYAYVGVLCRLKRRYMNRQVLRKLCLNTKNDLLREITKSLFYRSEVLPIGEFCRLNRILLRDYLENYCQLTVLTSKKMSNQAHLEHFERKRQIAEHLYGKVRWLLVVDWTLTASLWKIIKNGTEECCKSDVWELWTQP